jgi:SAM-dependent methyltransferase
VPSRIKQLAKKSTALIIAAKIYDNWRLKRRFQSGNFESLHGSTHSTVIHDLSESVGYINEQFSDYLRYSALPVERLRGMRTFELGFGDNVGVALKFIVAGVSRAVCLDKFYSKRDTAQQRAIYLALRETLEPAQKKLYDDAIDLSRGVEINKDKIQCIYGVDVENAQELFKVDPFDLALSRGAIQDIYEPEEAFRAMDRLLKPGGYMLHKIDLSDQGMFRDNGKNPLTFLTVPERIYRLMAIDSGKPNRKLMAYYRTVMSEMGYDAKVLITDIIGVGVVGKGAIHPHKEKISLNEDYTESSLDLVKSIRPRLIPRFRAMSDLELLVDGIFIIARKGEPSSH